MFTEEQEGKENLTTLCKFLFKHLILKCLFLIAFHSKPYDFNINSDCKYLLIINYYSLV